MGQPYDQLIVVKDYQGNLARARNKGWQALAPYCDVIAFTDDDAIPDEHFVEEGRKYFENNWIDFMQGKVHGGLNTSEDFFYVGANFWCKVSSLKNVGGFDEKYIFAVHEDLDFGWRLEEAGGKVAYNPKCKVYHEKEEQHHKNKNNDALIFGRFPERYRKLVKENTSRK